MGKRKGWIKLVLDERLCEYGCGGLAHYEFNNGRVCCSFNIWACPFVSNKCTTIWKSKYGNRDPLPQFCKCGCERETTLGYRYIRGHNNANNPVLPKISILCRCGCEQITIPGNKFIHGHNQRGKPGISRYGKDNSFYGKKHTEEVMAIIKAKNKGRKSWNKGLTKETDVRVAKISEAKKGKRRPDSRERLLKLGKANNPMLQPEAQRKRLENLRSESTRKKMRITRMKVIQKWLDEGGHAHPAYNSNACEFFKQFDKDFSTQGQYAINGGEFCIEALGYWVDYINFDLELIIEWDEEIHYDIDGNLKEKDVRRQKEIQEHFSDFLFLRIREEEFQKEDFYGSMRRFRRKK